MLLLFCRYGVVGSPIHTIFSPLSHPLSVKAKLTRYAFTARVAISNCTFSGSHQHHGDPRSSVRHGCWYQLILVYLTSWQHFLVCLRRLIWLGESQVLTRSPQAPPVTLIRWAIVSTSIHTSCNARSLGSTWSHPSRSGFCPRPIRADKITKNGEEMLQATSERHRTRHYSEFF